MASRFTYSRWDGTQRGFEIDADSLLDELADELTYHGDINTAMRKMMQNGMRDVNGNQMPGLRELMKRLREQREQIQERGDLGGVYSEMTLLMKSGKLPAITSRSTCCPTIWQARFANCSTTTLNQPPRKSVLMH
jgi:hypothetical protein